MRVSNSPVLQDNYMQIQKQLKNPQIMKRNNYSNLYLKTINNEDLNHVISNNNSPHDYA